MSGPEPAERRPAGPWPSLACQASQATSGGRWRRWPTAVRGLGLTERDLQRLKTAVAEATMNAMEHGNRYRAEVPVLIEMSVSDTQISVKITDEGSGPPAFTPRRPTWRPS